MTGVSASPRRPAEMLVFGLACALLLGMLFSTRPCHAGIARSLVVSGNNGVSEDPGFPTSWVEFDGDVYSCRIDRDSPDMVYQSPEGFQFYYGTFPVARAGLLYFDVSSIPQGRRIKQAILHAKTWWAGFSPDLLRPDSLFACADTSASDARWVGANQATWSEPREGVSGPWVPSLAVRTTYRQFGIVSKPQTLPVPPGLGQPGIGWFSLDVTRGVQAWVNGKANAGFWLFGRAWFNKNMSVFWSQAVDPACRPWLEVVWEDEPYHGPWFGGNEVAFTFSTDDGFRDNMVWASLLDSLDAKFTVCVVDSYVTIGNQGVTNWLNDGDLQSLASRGHEIASHSRTHRRWTPEVVPDSVVVWGLDRACIEQHIGGLQEIVSLAWPFHAHNPRMCEIARQAGYIVGRNGGIDYAPHQRGRLCNWDSCRVYEVGLTCYTQRIVSDEQTTRAYIRACVTEGIEHGNAWINLFAHTIDGRYDGVDVTRPELIWVIDELRRSGMVWIETMGNVARYYREFHTPSPGDPLLLILNTRPVAVADFVTLDQGDTVDVDVLANDFDPDGILDPASVHVVSGPLHGEATVSLETGAVTYTAAAAFAGTDTLYYTVCDDRGAPSSPAALALEVRDTTPPGPAQDLRARPGNERVTVSWNYEADDVGVFEVWRAGWVDVQGYSVYPRYDNDPDAVIPARPASRQEAHSGGLWSLAGAVPAFSRSFVDTVITRDVYYYEVFARDAAGNSGPPAAENARSVNYWLGDVVSPHGFVDVVDISCLGGTYGLVDGAPGFNAEADVGPTEDMSPLGIPLTDGIIDFEDLMVFAMNFGTVQPLRGMPSSEAVRLAWLPGEEGAWSLRLLAAAPRCHGLRISLPLTPGSVLAVERGELLERFPTPVFLNNIASRGLDLALVVLGQNAGFQEAGDLCRVVLASGERPEGATFEARSLDNVPIDVELCALTDVPPPARHRLAQNSPNPFNPRTTIEFELPARQPVRLAIYALDGRLVQTLVATELEAGTHEAIWDGRDSRGASVASGVYVYRLQAGAFRESRRMMLLR